MRRLFVFSLLFATACSGSDAVTDAQTGTDVGLDAGTADTGADAGSVDTGLPDSGAVDAASPDTGAPDLGPPDLGPPDTGAAPTWEADIAPLFTTYCVPCHDTGNPNRDYNLYADAFRDRDEIRCGVSPTRPTGCNGFPPPAQFPVGNGPMPTDAERLLIVEWVESGAAER